jgi:hypothetical protein
MNNPKFTRFLYDVNDVKYCLLMSLLEKNIDDTIFWIYELYLYDKEICWNTIWEIFYDFYGLYNPKGEVMITNFYNNGFHTIENLITICDNMVQWKSDPRIFLAHQAYKQVYPITSSYKGPVKLWIKNYDIKYRNLLRSLDKQNFYNVAYYLNALYTESKDDIYNIFKTICSFYSKQKGFTVKEGVYEHLLNDNPYKNKIHIVLAVTMYLTIDDSKINNTNHKYCSTEDELGILKLIDNFKGLKVNNVLQTKRIPINNNIYTFKRNNINSHKWTENINYCSWWKRKIEKYNGIIQENTIEFNSSKSSEKFYKRFDYLKDNSINIIDINTVSVDYTKNWTTWIHDYFKDYKNDMPFPTQFHFIL